MLLIKFCSQDRKTYLQPQRGVWSSIGLNKAEAKHNSSFLQFINRLQQWSRTQWDVKELLEIMSDYIAEMINELKDRGCRSVIWVVDPWMMWSGREESKTTTRVYIGWWAISGDCRLFQVQTLIIHPIGLVCGTGCASVVARHVEKSVLRFDWLRRIFSGKI